MTVLALTVSEMNELPPHSIVQNIDRPGKVAVKNRMGAWVNTGSPYHHTAEDLYNLLGPYRLVYMPVNVPTPTKD